MEHETLRRHEDMKRLIGELRELPIHGGWTFAYEYPGHFCYSHVALPFYVCFTPDWDVENTLPIEVRDESGTLYEDLSMVLPLAADGRSGQQLFDLVRPTLDKLETQCQVTLVNGSSPEPKRNLTLEPDDE